MLFVYKPEGADPRKWEFDPTRLMSPEVEAIERHTGLTFEGWVEACGKGSFIALHGLLWVLLKRSSPTLKYDEVQFCMADLDFEMDEQERAEMRAELEAKPDRTPAEERVLAELIESGVEAAEAPAEGKG